MVRHEGRMRQCRASGDDLGAADIDTGVGLLYRVHATSRAREGAILIHRRMNDGMVQVEHLLLRLLVPRPGVVLIRRVKLGVRSQGTEKRPFVVRRTPQPAISQTGPGGDGVACGELFFPGDRGAK